MSLATQQLAMQLGADELFHVAWQVAATIATFAGSFKSGPRDIAGVINSRNEFRQRWLKLLHISAIILLHLPEAETKTDHVIDKLGEYPSLVRTEHGRRDACTKRRREHGKQWREQLHHKRNGRVTTEDRGRERLAPRQQHQARTLLLGAIVACSFWEAQWLGSLSDRAEMLQSEHRRVSILCKGEMAASILVVLHIRVLREPVGRVSRTRQLWVSITDRQIVLGDAVNDAVDICTL
mmetsp:Transcript_73382/g.122613  ORF Transcript_73382/g.122613 Transcript_73382/m.122613 type:complete len:237 (+) Transcript_73382:734-1444(+)